LVSFWIDERIKVLAVSSFDEEPFVGFVKIRGLVTPDEPGASPGSFSRKAADKALVRHGEWTVNCPPWLRALFF